MRVKLNWVELLAVLSIIGVLVGLLMPAQLMPGSDFDLKHRYPPLASRHICVEVLLIGRNPIARDFALCCRQIEIA